MPHLPRVIRIELQDHSILELIPKKEGKALFGVSEKALFVDREGKEYFVKEAKPRRITDIFKNDPFFNELIFHCWKLLGEKEFDPSFLYADNEETKHKVAILSVADRILYDQIQAKLQDYQRHVDELVLLNTALEVIASHLCAHVMGNIITTPRDYLYLHQGRPLIISPSVGELREFLSEHPLVKQAKTPLYWFDHSRPNFMSLVTTTDEARLLGQAYCCALLFSHYDLLNNINFSNFGDNPKHEGCIVDWGNSIGVGFNGLTADESAFSNQEFKDCASGLDLQQCDVTSCHHMMPFDKIVYPLLPRQIAPDLFDLTAKDSSPLRAAQRRGFYEACDQALSMVDHLQEITVTTVKHTLESAMSTADAARVLPLLPKFITSEITADQEKYTLPNIIVGRMHSLQQMKTALQAGQTLQEIASERLSIITASQVLPSQSFFAKTKGPTFEPQLFIKSKSISV